MLSKKTNYTTKRIKIERKKEDQCFSADVTHGSVRDLLGAVKIRTGLEEEEENPIDSFLN